jgi:hypothetical protein
MELMAKLIRVLTAACAVSLLGCAFGQESDPRSTISISGQIVDPIGAVIPSARVWLTLRADHQVAAETKTNERGTFRIPAAPGAGSFSCTFRRRASGLL